MVRPILVGTDPLNPRVGLSEEAASTDPPSCSIRHYIRIVVTSTNPEGRLTAPRIQTPAWDAGINAIIVYGQCSPL